MKELFTSDLALLTYTVGLFSLGSALYRRTRLMILHPVLLTFLSMILLLKIFGVGYEEYRAATQIFDFGLGLSVVALGYLMYEQREQLRGSLKPILVATLSGCVAGVLTVIYVARWLGADRLLQTSLAPKSVTVPIAVAVAEPLGGIVSITSVVVFLTGVFGAVCGSWILDRCRISDPAARGFAMGSAAHGVGTSRAIEMGALEGALSGLAMALMGLTTALLLPLIERYLY